MIWAFIEFGVDRSKSLKFFFCGFCTAEIMFLVLGARISRRIGLFLREICNFA